MTAITDRQVRVLSTACVLGVADALEALSPFERDLLKELAQRFLDFGRKAIVTEAESEVLEDVLVAMARRAYPAFVAEFRHGVLVGVRPGDTAELGAAAS